MKKNRAVLQTVLLLLGMIVLAVGLAGISGMTRTWAGLCTGVGAGLIGMNVANLIIGAYYRNHPEVQKQSDIEAKDERNVTITNKAKAKAFDLTLKVLIIVPFLLILADSPLWMTLAAVGVYLFGFGAQIYFMMRYGKEM
ncbi:hypothetical protein [Paenibacillus macerans]|uniref:hypothetical protein n=1 Tax=Paenibacillus macerans TaxID=44252 RepID=UPI003D315718